jgi:hypothetical protein
MLTISTVNVPTGIVILVTGSLSYGLLFRFWL